MAWSKPVPLAAMVSFSVPLEIVSGVAVAVADSVAHTPAPIATATAPTTAASASGRQAERRRPVEVEWFAMSRSLSYRLRPMRCDGTRVRRPPLASLCPFSRFPQA